MILGPARKEVQKVCSIIFDSSRSNGRKTEASRRSNFKLLGAEHYSFGEIVELGCH